jgi:hypothetical protein
LSAANVLTLKNTVPMSWMSAASQSIRRGSHDAGRQRRWSGASSPRQETLTASSHCRKAALVNSSEPAKKTAPIAASSDDDPNCDAIAPAAKHADGCEQRAHPRRHAARALAARERQFANDLSGARRRARVTKGPGPSCTTAVQPSAGPCPKLSRVGGGSVVGDRARAVGLERKAAACPRHQAALEVVGPVAGAAEGPRRCSSARPWYTNTTGVARSMLSASSESLSRWR